MAWAATLGPGGHIVASSYLYTGSCLVPLGGEAGTRGRPRQGRAGMSSRRAVKASHCGVEETNLCEETNNNIQGGREGRRLGEEGEAETKGWAHGREKRQRARVGETAFEHRSIGMERERGRERERER